MSEQIMETELTSINILKNIKNKEIDPKILSKEQRQMTIPFLMNEGHSTAEIAHLFKVSDKTIQRDKQDIRQLNALTKNPELTKQMAGRLFNEADTCIQRLRKLQRDPNCPPAAKIEAERICFDILDKLVERLQSMGYVDTVVKKLEADLTHHAEGNLSLDDIDSEIKRIKQIESKIVENENE